MCKRIYGYYFLENSRKDIIVKWGNNWKFNDFSEFGGRTTFNTLEEAQNAIKEIQIQGLCVDDIKIRTVIYKVGTIKNLEMNCKERFIFKFYVDGLSDKEQLKNFLYDNGFCDDFEVVSCRNISSVEFKILDKVLSFSGLDMKEAGVLTLELEEICI